MTNIQSIFRLKTDTSISGENSNEISVGSSKKILKLLKKKREILDYEIVKEPITSKYRIDSLNKRVKARFFKMVHQTLSSFVSLKIKKIPQKVVTNVSIKFNKQLLNETVKSIYQKNVDNFPSDEELKTLVPFDKQEIFFDIINSSFIDCFKNYIQCPIFQNHLKEIEKKNGSLFKDIFEDECKRFVEYYLLSKPKKSETN